MTTTRDGRVLHVERAGTGSPAVVFESGMGMSRSCWAAVVPAVARVTSTVVYDRAGLGRSPVDTAPRTLDRLVDDHVDVLRELGSGPYVLVGHSWGGPIVRSAAALAPELVIGLLLVDQTDEACDLYFAANAERQFAITARVLPVLARTGVLRLAVGRIARGLPASAAAAMRTEDTTVAAAKTQIAELASSIEDMRWLREHPPAVPDVPVSLLSGTRASRLGRRRRDALVATHRDSAARLPKGRHVVSDRSGHNIPMTDPQLVAEENIRIVRIARGEHVD